MRGWVFVFWMKGKNIRVICKSAREGETGWSWARFCKYDKNENKEIVLVKKVMWEKKGNAYYFDEDFSDLLRSFIGKSYYKASWIVDERDIEIQNEDITAWIESKRKEGEENG